MIAIAKPGPRPVRWLRFVLGLCAAAIGLPAGRGVSPSRRLPLRRMAFPYGFAHPFSGIDHVLAMVAVGLFAAHLGHHVLRIVPLSFVSIMTLAGIAGTAGASLPFNEIGIALSVVVLGLAVAFQLDLPHSPLRGSCRIFRPIPRLCSRC